MSERGKTKLLANLDELAAKLLEAHGGILKIKTLVSDGTLKHKVVCVSFMELTGLMDDFLDVVKDFPLETSQYPDTEPATAAAGAKLPPDVVKKLDKLEKEISAFRIDSISGQNKLLQRIDSLAQDIRLVEKDGCRTQETMSKMHEAIFGTGKEFKSRIERQCIYSKMELMEKEILTSQEKLKETTVKVKGFEVEMRKVKPVFAQADRLVTLQKVMNRLHLSKQYKIELTKEVEKLTKRLDTAEKQSSSRAVMFRTKMETQNGKGDDGSPITKTVRVGSNVGDAFHKDRGVFVTPIDGYYIMTATIRQDNDGELEVNIRRNNEWIGRASTLKTSANQDIRMCVGLVALKKDDVVDVLLWKVVGQAKLGFCYFHGCRLG